MTVYEINIDGLVGPTHNYAGLSFGNVASQKYALSVSNPRQAALQGLAKMRFLHGLGLKQMVMPPQPRPDWKLLHRLGFKRLEDVPDALLHAIYSASSMWTANAATVSPSSDTADGRVHFTPANLTSKFHRAIEAGATAHYLKQLFPGEAFLHHAPLPAHSLLADEGAANHMRLARAHGEPGLEIFVYGGPSRIFPARQSRLASEAVIRLHKLDRSGALLLEQSAEAIDAGVFHNDVIAMSNGPLLIYHEKAYTRLDGGLEAYSGICIHERDLPLSDAVSTYFFNSQLVTLPSGGMAVIAPSECEEKPQAKACFDRLVADGHIERVHYLNLRESMKNGGGPACLRLRVVLTPGELEQAHAGAVYTPALDAALCQWIEKHYRDRIGPHDLRDESLARESSEALERLSVLLGMDIGNN